MTPARTTEGKWLLYRVSDGQCVEHWPIDARAMIESGNYTVTPPAGVSAPVADPPTADPVPHVAQAKADVEAKSPTGAPLVIGGVVEVTPAAAPTPAPPAAAPKPPRTPRAPKP